MKTVNFSEKQGRIVLEVTCYLEMDLDNKEIMEVLKDLQVEVYHPLISDREYGIINENGVVI